MCCLSFDSDYTFSIFWPLCCLSFDSDYTFSVFWPLCCLSFESDYTFSIFKLFLHYNKTTNDYIQFLNSLSILEHKS